MSKQKLIVSNLSTRFVQAPLCQCLPARERRKVRGCGSTCDAFQVPISAAHPGFVRTSCKADVRDNGGFTFVEVLAALIIMGLLTSIVACGMNLAVKISSAAAFQSHATMLATTIDNALTYPLESIKYSPTSGEWTLTTSTGDAAKTLYASTAGDSDNEASATTSSSTSEGTSASTLTLSCNVSGEEGYLYWTGKANKNDVGDSSSADTTAKLLNTGAYNDVRVTSVSWTCTYVTNDGSENAITPYITSTVKLVIASSDDSSLGTNTYTYTYRSSNGATTIQ